MERQSKFLGNPEYDEILSEEDDAEDGDIVANCVSLEGNTGKEESFGLQSRLEMLTGSHGVLHGRGTANSLLEKQSPPLEDDVEAPDFPCESEFAYSERRVVPCISDEELISDDEEKSTMPKFSRHHGAKLSDGSDYHGPEGAHEMVTWSAVTEEARALVYSNVNAGPCSSFYSANCKAKKAKDVKSKMKPEFSFLFKSGEEKFPVFCETPERFDHDGEEIVDDSSPEHPEALCGRKRNYSEITPGKPRALQHARNQHPVTEQQYNGQRGGALQLDIKRDTFTLGGRSGDSELPENMGSPSSSDNETDLPNLTKLILRQRKPCIADRLDEALNATALSDQGLILTVPKSSGLFAKLQQVMRSEKERDSDFLRMLQARVRTVDDSNYIDTRILSRHLDAKLTVCRCSIIQCLEDTPSHNSSEASASKGREMRIIFSPRACGNVELEVGNSIRVHAPWNEFQEPGTGRKILLCAYFSEPPADASSVHPRKC